MRCGGGEWAAFQAAGSRNLCKAKMPHKKHAKSWHATQTCLREGGDAGAAWQVGPQACKGRWRGELLMQKGVSCAQWLGKNTRQGEEVLAQNASHTRTSHAGRKGQHAVARPVPATTVVRLALSCPCPPKTSPPVCPPVKITLKCHKTPAITWHMVDRHEWRNAKSKMLWGIMVKGRVEGR